MKYVLLFFAAIFLMNCKTKKSGGASTTETVKFMPTDKELAVAQKNWPNTSMDQLKEGHAIYKNDCSKCHENFEITKFGEAKWKKMIDVMAPKAKLTDEQKDKLSRFLLSYREANTPAAK